MRMTNKLLIHWDKSDEIWYKNAFWYNFERKDMNHKARSLLLDEFRHNWN